MTVFYWFVGIALVLNVGLLFWLWLVYQEMERIDQ